MDWYKQGGVFHTINPQGETVPFDTVHIYAESAEHAQEQIRSALEDATGIYHISVYPNTPQERMYHLIADSQDRAEGWAKVIYRLENQQEATQ